MINITNIINKIKDFNHSLYADHRRVDKIISEGYYLHRDKWFDKLGQFAGNTPDDVCKSHGIEYTIYQPVDYHAVSDGEVIALHDVGETIHQIEGVNVWVSTDGSSI